MKKIISALVLIFLLQFSFAQNTHMTFKGIEIDGTLNEFVAKLKSTGFTVDYQLDNGVVMKGKFAGENAELIIPCSPGQKVWKVAVKFDKMNTWFSLKNSYYSYKKSLSEKYGEGLSFEFFSSPYEEGDGYELTAVKVEKCTYYTSFSTENGNVSVEIDKAGCISISYEDKTNLDANKQKKEQQKFDDL